MKRIVPIALLLLTCIFLTHYNSRAQALQTGKSYVNITKGATGGTIEAGDILEIRATIAVGDFSTNPIITNVRFNDTIPANTTYIANTLKILSNEGLVWRSLTDPNDLNDQGRINGNFLRINMGSSYNGNAPATVNLGTAPPNDANPTTGGGGRINYNGRPSFYGGVCIMSASYRIRINSPLAYGTTINMFGGAFRFDSTSARIRPLPAYKIVLTQNVGLCTNSIGANAIIDNGGTFGSGITQNRSTSAIVPGYTFANVAFGLPNDGAYSIVNNMSPSGSVNVNYIIPDTNQVNASITRVHRLWDIMGDHTGAAVPSAGNLPVAPGANGGYFVAINASYANNNAIKQTVKGLCPNTYYEFSAWFKNICKYCACDTTGDPPYRQVSAGQVFIKNTNFNGPDSSGVNPNLTFTIDSTDYYTTGTLLYTGQWVKKGFIYRTGPTQDSFTLTIRNNAAGGGGNDWGIDDVTLATCTPNLNLQPSPSMAVCYNFTIDMFAVVRSFFPNYANWRWERSTDGGANWTNTGVGGTGTPVLVSGEYQYTATYPTFLADSSVHNNRFRIRIASTPQNLNNASCSFIASTTISVLVNNCSVVLKNDFLDFSGSVSNNLAHLQWTVADELPGVRYEIESSQDNSHFEQAGIIQGNSTGAGTSSYHFTDSRPLNGPRYYRIKAVGASLYKYSKTILLSSSELKFTVLSVVNPFSNRINIELVSPDDGPVVVSLLDMYGRMLKQTKETLQKGLNSLQVSSLEKLPAGSYMLQIKAKDKVINKSLLKLKK
jgi:uncharacterized repeat protein (TIGR01451 family)